MSTLDVRQADKAMRDRTRRTEDIMRVYIDFG